MNEQDEANDTQLSRASFELPYNPILDLMVIWIHAGLLFSPSVRWHMTLGDAPGCRHIYWNLSGRVAGTSTAGR